MPKEELEFSEAKFTGEVKAVDFKDLEKLGLSKASFMSQAKSLIPESFDHSKNIDVMPVVFNLAVVNKFNANGDGISSKCAAKVLKQFINKPINIEHKKTMIVGHIINASFSDKQPDFQENDIIDFIDRKDPFYITAAGIIYKHVYPKLAEALLEASTPDDPHYKAYATSWEIAFSQYDIAVGPSELQSCEVYSKGDMEYEALSSNLKALGGDGYSDSGKPVNRLLAGEKYPVGCALTENPAADVEGVYTLDSLVEAYDEEYQNNSSQNEENNVIDKNDNNHLIDMTDEQFKEMMDRLEALASKNGEGEQQESLANGFEEIKTVLKEAGGEWKSKAEKSKEDLEKAQNDLKELQDKFSNAEEELNNVKEELKVKEAADKFNQRMDSIAALFELDEAEEEIVAKEVKDLSSEAEDFDNYVNKLKVLMASKLKENLEQNQEEENQESTASQEEEKEIETENSESSNSGVTNNNGNDSQEEGLIERLRKNGLALAE